MKIAVLGCGVVGSGVVEIIGEKAEKLAAKCNQKEFEIKYILDLRDLSDRPYASKAVKDIDIIVNDPEISVVVETMGGIEPAFTFVMRCLNAGKNAVTSNKALVAAKGSELFEAAKKNNVKFYFEAAVCGGIPAIRTMFSDLAANNITSFRGILNGTTNFILDKMISDKMSFDTALALAQKNGFAEKDPTADIEGLDACRKLCILSSIAFGTHIYPEEIHTEGITNITLEDIAYANNAGYKIKLLGRASRLADEKIYAVVSPCLISENLLVSRVDGVLNALEIEGDSVGSIILCGAGAGSLPTASAVVGDVLACGYYEGSDFSYMWDAHEDGKLADYTAAETSLFVRGFSKDVKKAIAEIRESFESVRILSRNNAPENETAFITNKAPENELKEILGNLRDFTAAAVIRTAD